jgi:hypothetical protein
MGKAADALGRVGARLRTLPQEGVAEATKILRTELRRQVADDIGPDMKMSGLRNGVAFRVKVTQRGEQLVEGRVMAGPEDQRAPWFWLEEGTKPGYRGAPVGRYGSARAFRGNHPGTPGKQTWSRSFRSVEDRIRADMEARWRRANEG